MNKDVLKERTKEFAHRCVKLSLKLDKDRLSSHIQGQLIRCATSVAVNYRAACLAQSTKSFGAKLSIVIEECDESYFWLEFLVDEGIIKKELVESLINEAYELTSIFVSSRKTINSNQSKKRVDFNK